MKKLTKKEVVFLVVIRTIANEEQMNEHTMTVNEDKMKTPYPVEV